MKIAIIGAGATGLTAAYELVQAGHQITIFEADASVGGLASGFKEKKWDWSLEKYYHHWFASDSHLQQLMQDLDVSSNVIYSQPKTAVYYRRKFYPLDTPISVLKFPGLSLIQKFRFSYITLYLKFFADWKKLEKHTAHSWLISKYGSSIYSIIWQPLLKGKFGPYYKKVNMAWMWARIKARTAKLGTYEGGFQQFFDDFADILKSSGVQIHLTSPVSQIYPTKNGTIKVTSNQKRIQVFDRCLVTTSPFIFGKVLPKDIDMGNYASKLEDLDSLGAIVLVLSLKHPLSKEKFYWYNLPKSKQFPFLALVEHTNFVDPKNFNGEHIIYCGDYVLKDHEYFKYSKTKLIKKFIPTLKKINPKFQSDWIQASWLYTSSYAQPVPYISHSSNIPPIQTPVKNIYYAGMSQVYPWDRGTNFAVKIGKDAAKLIANSYSHE